MRGGIVIAEGDFKAVMASAPGPATVVTTFDGDGRPHGLTVSAVCSVSLDPPLVLACLDLGSNTLEALRQSGSFSINYLANGREGVALGFATKAGTKFDGQVWAAPGAGIGGPILTDHVVAHVACRTEKIVPAGDHVIVIGGVIEGGSDEGALPLAYARRRFFSVEEVAIEEDSIAKEGRA